MSASVLAAAGDPDGGVRFVPILGLERAEVVHQVLAEAAKLGFVAIRQDARTEADREAASHRHTVVICTNANDGRWVVGWVRRLAQASPRLHLVLWPAGQESLASESSCQPCRVASRPEFESVSARLNRADSWARRGRPRSAERWLAAAAASAERHGDPRATDLDAAICRRLCAEGRSDEARARLRALLRVPDLAWDLYAETGALWADVAIAAGEFGHADSWLRSLATEAAIRQLGLPPIVRERVSELRFWIGKSLEEGRIGEGRSSEELGWEALRAWRHSERSILMNAIALLESRSQHGDDAAKYWMSVLRLLAPGEDPAPVVVRIQDAEAAAKSPGIPVRRRRLAGAICAWAWRRSGTGDRTPTLHTVGQSQAPEHQLIRALTGAASSRLPGVLAFLMEDTSMHSVDGLGRLLQVMEDASDEQAALTAGCAWVRRHGADVCVGIVSADGQQLVASQGWKPADVSGPIGGILSGPQRDVRLGRLQQPSAGFGMSVRYGGSTIAYLVVGGGAAFVSSDTLRHAVEAFTLLCGSAVRARLDALDLRLHDRDGLQEILGRSQSIIDVRTAVTRAAVTSFPVLIEGESGTGKELVSRALHRLSPRRDRRFMAVNCAALTDDLIEAELFGHARGAFTGAVGPRAGLFEEAHGGTLFLDEVSELTPRAQAKLLRVLQEREVRRVGENAARPVDVRIVAATNLPLSEAVARGKFRDDLRFRLAVIGIRLPPLRERLEDLPLLIHVFWRRALAETGKRAVLTPAALARLARHSWPGNVRELQNIVAGLAVAAPSCGRVTDRHVNQVLTHECGDTNESNQPGLPLEAARRVFERRLVAATMARHAGRRSAAAQELGLTRQGLAKTLRRLGLAEDESTAGVA